MVSTLEKTAKALTGFEAELDRTRAEALAEKTRIIREAEGIAESAKSSAISRAQQQALERLVKARTEAEKQAESIRKQGVSSLRAFEASVSLRKKKAAGAVVMALLGEVK